MNDYKNMLDDVKASEQAKQKTALKLQQAYAEKKRGGKFGRTLRYACAAAASVCIIFVAVLAAVMFSPSHGDNKTQRACFSTNETCIIDSSSVTFNEIRISERQDGTFIIINGVFDFENFSISEEGIRLYPAEGKNADRLIFSFNAELTEQLSEANLNINSSPARTVGAVSLVFNTESATAEFLKECKETDGCLELTINVLYVGGTTPVFIFGFDEIAIE